VALAYLYFDLDEPFMHDFRQRWLQEKKGKVVFLNTFWGSIVEVEALDSILRLRVRGCKTDCVNDVLLI
jgi:hypothetical protein